MEQENAFLSSIGPLCGAPRNFVFTPESEDFGRRIELPSHVSSTIINPISDVLGGLAAKLGRGVTLSIDGQ